MNKAKTVLETIVKNVLECVCTTNAAVEIVQLKVECCTFGWLPQLNKDKISKNGGIVCVCIIETTRCSG